MATSGRHASAGMLLAAFAGAGLLLVPVSAVFPGPASGVRPAAGSAAAASPAHAAARRVQRGRASAASAAHLTVPKLPLPVQVTYTVVSGDALSAIAQAAGVDVKVLAAANRLSATSLLHLGQVLVVPVPGLRVPKLAAAVRSAPASPPRTRPAAHAVVPGDTLWTIAHAAGVGVDALARANGLAAAGTLRPGRVLTIPAPGAPAAHPLTRVTPMPNPAPVRSASPARTSGQAPPHRRRLALRWPSGGIITSRFGWRIHPIFGTREFHTGIDIATRWGSPVVAARAGIVRFVGWKHGYGRIIVIDHGAGLKTYYSHLSAALVNPGQRVARGQMIGRIGCTGWCTGPHLFFEVRKNGEPLDPSHYLN